MFKAGDKVEIVAEDDPLKGSFGEVVGVHPDHGWISIVLDDGEDLGNPVLWYGFGELRKVDA